MAGMNIERESGLSPSEPYQTIVNDESDEDQHTCDTEESNDIEQNFLCNSLVMSTSHELSLRCESGEQETVNKAALENMIKAMDYMKEKCNKYQEHYSLSKKDILKLTKEIKRLKSAPNECLTCSVTRKLVETDNTIPKPFNRLCPTVLSVSSQTDLSVTPFTEPSNLCTELKHLTVHQPQISGIIQANELLGANRAAVQVSDALLSTPVDADDSVPSKCTEDSFSIIDSMLRGDSVIAADGPPVTSNDRYDIQLRYRDDGAKLSDHDKVQQLQNECQQLREELQKANAKPGDTSPQKHAKEVAYFTEQFKVMCKKLIGINSGLTKQEALIQQIYKNKGYRGYHEKITHSFPIQQGGFRSHTSPPRQILKSSLSPDQMGVSPSRLSASMGNIQPRPSLNQQQTNRSSTLPVTTPKPSASLYDFQGDLLRKYDTNRSQQYVASDAKQRSKSEDGVIRKSMEMEAPDNNVVSGGFAVTGLSSAVNKYRHGHTTSPSHPPVSIDINNIGDAVPAMVRKRSVVETTAAVQESLTPVPSGRVCPMCKRDFSRITMDAFQTHVFDCADKSDTRLPTPESLCFSQE